MTILITGASGFVGRNFLQNTVHDGPFVALYHSDDKFPEWVHSLGKDVRDYRVDLSDLSSTKATADGIGDVDVCLYLAANSDPRWSMEHPLEDLQQNTTALVNLLSSLKSCRHFVFFSSGAVYQGAKGIVDPETPIRPKIPYAISKYTCENYIRYFCDKGAIDRFTILRYFGGYGPYEPSRKIFSRLVRELHIEKKDEFRVLGDGNNQIDAMAALDTVHGLDRVVRSKGGGSVIVDFSAGVPITVGELVNRTAALLDRKDARIRYEGKVAEYNEFFARTDGFYARFGFEPSLSLEEGMKPLIEWIEKGAPR